LNLSPNQTPSPYYGFYDWPEDFRVEDLEVYIEYRIPADNELILCNHLEFAPPRLVATEILLPTDN
ncbi:MAG: hypothetical protein WBA16_01900, partial [Nonlabens sp.]